MGRFILSGKTNRSRSYRSEVLGSNPIQCNFFLLYMCTTGPGTQCLNYKLTIIVNSEGTACCDDTDNLDEKTQ